MLLSRRSRGIAGKSSGGWTAKIRSVMKGWRRSDRVVAESNGCRMKQFLTNWPRVPRRAAFRLNSFRGGLESKWDSVGRSFAALRCLMSRVVTRIPTVCRLAMPRPCHDPHGTIRWLFHIMLAVLIPAWAPAGGRRRAAGTSVRARGGGVARCTCTTSRQRSRCRR